MPKKTVKFADEKENNPAKGLKKAPTGINTKAKEENLKMDDYKDEEIDKDDDDLISESSEEFDINSVEGPDSDTEGVEGEGEKKDDNEEDYDSDDDIVDFEEEKEEDKPVEEGDEEGGIDSEDEEGRKKDDIDLLEAEADEEACAYQLRSILEPNVRVPPTKAEEEKKITGNTLEFFEYVRVLSQRTLQLAKGAPPAIRGIEGKDPFEIAQIELKNKVIPYIIRRPRPGGKYEEVRLADLEIVDF